MAEIIKVGSYAEAEHRGIKPVDSIISVGSSPVYFEKKSKPPYKIVGWSQGYAFKEGEVSFAYGKAKSFVVFSPDGEQISITAINHSIAKKIAKEMFGKGASLFENKLRKVV